MGLKKNAARCRSRPGQLCKEQRIPRAYGLVLPYGTDPATGHHPRWCRIPGIGGCGSPGVLLLMLLAHPCTPSPALGRWRGATVGQGSDGRGEEGSAGHEMAVAAWAVRGFVKKEVSKNY